MKVRNRSGMMIDIDFDAIKRRMTRLCTEEELKRVDIDSVVIKTINGIYDGISTFDLDELSARVCASLQTTHYLYDDIAARITASNMAKTVWIKLGGDGDGDGAEGRQEQQGGGGGGGANVPFSTKMASMARRGMLDGAFAEYVSANGASLDAMVRYERDTVHHSYFSLRTLQRSYLARCPTDDLCIESPQDMWMRVAVAIHRPMKDEAHDALERIRECYDAMSTGQYTHATPTLFNAGMSVQQLSSCYLLGTQDSLAGIFKTIGDCAQISKWAGGIGVHVSNVRAKGARITSTSGVSDGIVPMLKVYNETARYCNQSGRRKGSIAVYLEPWHADVWEFVELRRNTGAETERARDLFLALWVPDEFMRRLERADDWYLMSPDVCPGLVDAVGDRFTELYERYISEGKFVRKVKALAMWQHILNCQLETGTPYIMYKDHVNLKCNQNNVGTIRSSNLCAEVTQYSDASQYAVCNLASIAIPRFVDVGAPGGIDHVALHEAARQVAMNLNRVIDINTYPTPEARLSNMAMRPIGIGVQGLGDVYCMLRLAYESPDAMRLDAEVMETIYHGALTASATLAERDGPYERFEGSPASRGLLQMDLWEAAGDIILHQTDRYDWAAMRERIRTSGMRNSMLTALMPTASTSQVLGNCESFEPFQSNLFKRSTMAGEFLVVNRHLMRELMAAGLWSEEVRRELLRADGSIQSIEGIPDEIKLVYRTVWEVGQRAVVDHATARGPFVDQSQSMNLYMAAPSFQKLSSALVHGWKRGLKTGMYYLRSTAAVEATKIGQAQKTSVAAEEAVPSESAPACAWRGAGAGAGDECLACSS